MQQLVGHIDRHPDPDLLVREFFIEGGLQNQLSRNNWDGRPEKEFRGADQGEYWSFGDLQAFTPCGQQFMGLHLCPGSLADVAEENKRPRTAQVLRELRSRHRHKDFIAQSCKIACHGISVPLNRSLATTRT